MKVHLLQSVKNFLQERVVIGKPLLLGFSGGPDSLTLFHLLLKINFPLHVAHVDHGWREESGQEALFLEKYVTERGVPFHLKKLLPCRREEKAREERLCFFAALYEKLGCQALLLGHQKDDQAETVLKRILEGAHLTSLGGIQEASCLKGMKLWRPLLKYSKKEIYTWLEENKLKALEDLTNHDPKFLRARMRIDIFPELAKKFGKEIGNNLSRIGETVHELTEYLEKKIAPYTHLIEKKGGKGEEVRVDFTRLSVFEPFEIKLFLKKWIEEEGIFLSHQAHTTLYQLIERGACKKKIMARKKIIEIHLRVVAIKNVEGYE